jgi:ribosomal protein L24
MATYSVKVGDYVFITALFFRGRCGRVVKIDGRKRFPVVVKIKGTEYLYKDSEVRLATDTEALKWKLTQ